MTGHAEVVMGETCQPKRGQSRGTGCYSKEERDFGNAHAGEYASAGRPTQPFAVRVRASHSLSRCLRSRLLDQLKSPPNPEKDFQMPTARPALASDLPSLLELFRASEVSAAAEPRERAEATWSQMLAHPGVAVFVSAVDDRAVATCMLITAPNLLRGGRTHGFLENVVTHPGFRGQGHGRAVVRAALTAAWANDCYHVLLQSGRKDPRVHRFYESCGFFGGRRVAYVAQRPGG